MGSPLERRRAEGRRRSDARDTRALRGLLHDLGHEITTLSYLVEAVRGDVGLPADSSYRLELLSLEMARLLDIIRHGLNGLDSAAGAEPIKVRELATQLARLAELGYEADVRLLPGPEATAFVNPVVLWRVLSNLVDNAARAAGSGGRVTVAIHPAETVTRVEVADTGPGFGWVPPGEASLGLEVVTSLLAACGGTLAVDSPPGGGTCVRIGLPAGAGSPARAGAGLGG
jgi:signal transduction histidine kinase